jgi:hypothetical protein
MTKKFKIYVLKDPGSLLIRYVGLTSQTLKSRLNNHLRDRDKTHKACWIRSLKKSYKKPIIELLYDNLSFEEAKILEIFEIKRLGSLYNLTNHSLGGEGTYGYKFTQQQKENCSRAQKERFRTNPLSNGHRQEVFQYTLDGVFIQKFNSINAAAKKVGCSQSNITQCCLGKRRMVGGFLWSYENKNIKLRPINGSSVIQYTKNNEYLNEFISIAEAARVTGINDGNISLVCNNVRKSAGGFLWKFKNIKND